MRFFNLHWTAFILILYGMVIIGVILRGKEIIRAQGPYNCTQICGGTCQVPGGVIDCYIKDYGCARGIRYFCWGSDTACYGGFRCWDCRDPDQVNELGCCDCPGDGGGGGGNNPPSCTINLQSPITYDGMEYVDKTTGQTKRKQPSTIQGRIRTSDPDGDRVRITKLTVSKPECLKVTRDGKKLYATPQGKITGKTPTLDGANYCDVRIRVQVSDGRGGTNNCSKTIRVNYPKPRIWAIWLYDHNDASVERQPANPLRDIQFYYIGSSRFYEPFTTTGALLDNPSSPTRTLKPRDQRFVITGYTKSDHNMLGVRVVLRDPNGNLNFDESPWRIYLDGPMNSYDIVLLRDGVHVYQPGSNKFLQINTYGIGAGGRVIRYRPPADQQPTTNDQRPTTNN